MNILTKSHQIVGYYSQISFPIKSCTRKCSAAVKLKAVLDERALGDDKETVIRPKEHPGIFKPRAFTLPDGFIEAVIKIAKDYPLKSLVEDGKMLINHLRDKRPPVEMSEFKKAKQNAYERVISKITLPPDVDEENEKMKNDIANKVNIILRREVYHWKPVSYDAYNSLVYVISRAPPEYAVLAKIFLEIAKRDPKFKPRSLFDFGSGVGSVTWAANLYWKNKIFEYFNVDSSSDMNDLAQLILQKGKGTNHKDLRGVFYRQFLPVSSNAYDLVVSAYTLLELPSQQSRLDTLLNLWNKTQKYLVLVEQGSNAGFEIINEARDFLLQAGTGTQNGHIFSPCPHDQMCPRYVAADGTPCNFEAFYFEFPFGQDGNIRQQERYSYVVFKKGMCDEQDPQWPRIVRQTLVRSKHTICRMCTKNAGLDEVIFTNSKHGKYLYHCARASKWGDLLPVTIQQPKNEDDSNLKLEEDEIK